MNDVFEVLPPADRPDEPVEPGSTPDPAARRRAAVELMVARCLDPAFGVCLRAFDRQGRDPQRWRHESRDVVNQALRVCARHRVADDDRAVHDVMRRVAEIGLDHLIGHPGRVPVPDGVDMPTLLSSGVTPAQVAPDGRLSLAELQDAMAASRAADRHVAIMVMAAGLHPDDTATLLGRRTEDVHAGLARVGRRLSEGHVGGRAGAPADLMAS